MQFEDKVIHLHGVDLSMIERKLLYWPTQKRQFKLKLVLKLVVFFFSTYINRKQIRSSEPITSHTIPLSQSEGQTPHEFNLLGPLTTLLASR